MQTITRELKTPLNSIVGLTNCAIELLGKEALCTTKFLRPMVQASDFLSLLIDDILDYSM